MSLRNEEQHDTMTTEAAISKNEIVASSNEARNGTNRKRKAEDQGKRNVVHRSPVVINEEEERSIEKLVWEDLWSDNVATFENATNKLIRALSAPAGYLTRDGNRKRIVDAGGHLILLKIIEKNLPVADNCSEFIYKSLFVLALLAEDHQEVPKIISRTPTVVESAIKIMEKFADHRRCCVVACGLLANVALANDDFKVKVYKSGGIPLVIGSMKRFAHSQTMQHFGVVLLRVLLKSKKEKKHIMATAHTRKALIVLAKAKYSFPNSQNIKTFATQCIKILNEN